MVVGCPAFPGLSEFPVPFLKTGGIVGCANGDALRLVQGVGVDCLPALDTGDGPWQVMGVKA